MNTDELEEYQGNIMISKYLYGEPEVTNYYQVGYKGINVVYRHKDELTNPFYNNFSNNWNLLMDAIAKMAKDKIEDFSNEDKIIDELKNNMFRFSYDIKQSWKVVVEYIKLKLTV